MPEFRLTKNVSHRYKGRMLKKGDVVTLTYGQYQSMKDRFEPVEVAKAEAALKPTEASPRPTKPSTSPSRRGQGDAASSS